MLTPLRVDTNSLTITDRLNSVGFEVRFKAVVGDSVDELATVLATALGLSDLVVCTGGLGPTEDDVTREAVARALQVPLEPDQAVLDRIRARFERRGRAMPEINRRQALVPRGAVVLDNEQGTAPGLWIARDRVGLLVLPGPPREMTPMLERAIDDRLVPHGAGTALYRRVVKITGLMDSEVDMRTHPVYSQWRDRPIPIATTILMAPGGIELHLTASAASRQEADRALGTAARELQETLGDAAYSADGRTLEAIVGDLLRAGSLTVATAESCTGGLLMSRLTDVPGSSAYVDRGFVCYSNRAKVEWLGVPEALIDEHGAVSEAVARAMAEGVRARAGTDIGIGVTGIAGPGGGTPAKPVGTVAICVATRDRVPVRTFRLHGDREMVKYQATQAALDMTRRLLMNLGT
jgi:nicotinamide-nucleotide amidase